MGPVAAAPAKRSSNAWIFIVVALGAFCLCGRGVLVALLHACRAESLERQPAAWPARTT